MRPAEDLLGEIIGNDWKVVEKLPSFTNGNDGKYSFRYVVKNGIKTAFLKAVDLNDAESKFGDYYKEIERITKRANNERIIAQMCAELRMKHVVRYIEGGEFLSVKHQTNRSRTVHYIIYEKASEDSKTYLDKFGDLSEGDIYTRLKAVHNVANALRAMHANNLAHQDIKPSNILLFKNNLNSDVFKIGDFDSAILRSELSLDEELEQQLNKHAGTYQFAPIELLYEYIVPDWNLLRKGTDLYLLGGLICFYFTGRSITEQIGDRIHLSHHWQRSNNKGNYKELLPVIDTAFEYCLVELRKILPQKANLNEELCTLIRKLSNPDPFKRGEKSRFNNNQYQLSLISTVSKLGHLMHRFK